MLTQPSNATQKPQFNQGQKPTQPQTQKPQQGSKGTITSKDSAKGKLWLLSHSLEESLASFFTKPAWATCRFFVLKFSRRRQNKGGLLKDRLFRFYVDLRLSE